MNRKIALLGIIFVMLWGAAASALPSTETEFVKSGTQFDEFKTFLDAFATAEETGIIATYMEYYFSDYKDRDYYNKYTAGDYNAVETSMTKYFSDYSGFDVSYDLDGYACKDETEGIYELYAQRTASFVKGGKTFFMDEDRGYVYTVKKDGTNWKLYGNRLGTDKLLVHLDYSMNFEVFCEGITKVIDKTYTNTYYPDWSSLQEAEDVGAYSGGVVVVVPEDSGKKDLMLGFKGAGKLYTINGTMPEKLTWLTITQDKPSTEGGVETAWERNYLTPATSNTEYTYEGIDDPMRSYTDPASAKKYWMANYQAFTDFAAVKHGVGPYIYGSPTASWKAGWFEFIPNTALADATASKKFFLPFRAKTPFAGMNNSEVEGLTVVPEIRVTYNSADLSLEAVRVVFVDKDSETDINGYKTPVDNSEAKLVTMYRTRVEYWTDKANNKRGKVEKIFDESIAADASAEALYGAFNWTLDATQKKAVGRVDNIRRIDITGVELRDGTDYRVNYYWAPTKLTVSRDLTNQNVVDTIHSGDMVVISEDVNYYYDGEVKDNVTSDDVGGDIEFPAISNDIVGGVDSDDENVGGDTSLQKVTFWVKYQSTKGKWDPKLRRYAIPYTVVFKTGDTSGAIDGALLKKKGVFSDVTNALQKLVDKYTSIYKVPEKDLTDAITSILPIYKGRYFEEDEETSWVNLIALVKEKFPNEPLSSFFYMNASQFWNAYKNGRDLSNIAITLSMNLVLIDGKYNDDEEFKVVPILKTAQFGLPGAFIVYDGEADRIFKDPLCIAKKASSPTPTPTPSEGGGGGCSAAYAPLAMLFLVPLFFRKRS